MNLRKTAVLLMAFGLTLGLIGTGLGASFTDEVTATENISVGTFGCEIDLIGDGLPPSSSITYNAPEIASSAAGNAPFTFTVTNVGSIPQQLTITDDGPDGKFSAMPLTPASPVVLGASGAQVFDTGIEWTELDNADLGTTGSITWTVACAELPAAPETQQVISNALNFSSTGWGGWSCPAGTEIVSADVALNSDGTGTPTDPIASLTLWEPGASVSGINYPNTGTSYVYTPPEEGAIVQNGGTGQTLYIVLECTLP
jgi:hypothetical protein